ncbi:MAG: hypothetical protein U0793_28680 [Gemmataceae bacterium]
MSALWLARQLASKLHLRVHGVLHRCFAGCDRHPVEQRAPDPAVKSDQSKGDAKVETWPARKEYPGLGSQLWEYCVPYQADMNKVLAELKDREFKAGRFHRSELKPKSFAEAIRNADAAGTRSIMDIEKVSPTRDIMAISPAPPEKLKTLFGADKPSRAMIENASKKMLHDFQVFLETYERGEGVYITIYDGDRPSEVYIAGWSSH